LRQGAKAVAFGMSFTGSYNVNGPTSFLYTVQHSCCCSVWA